MGNGENENENHSNILYISTHSYDVKWLHIRIENKPKKYLSSKYFSF